MLWLFVLHVVQIMIGGVVKMLLSQEATLDILDQGILRRTAKEAEVACHKCALYAEMAGEPKTKAFFVAQQKALEKTVNDLRALSTKVGGS